MYVIVNKNKDRYWRYDSRIEQYTIAPLVKHPVLYYLTPAADYKVELYAGIVVKRDALIYMPNPDETEFALFLHKAKTKSTFESNVEINENDTIITLLTCSYEYNNARYILIGKLIKIQTN